VRPGNDLLGEAFVVEVEQEPLGGADHGATAAAHLVENGPVGGDQLRRVVPLAGDQAPFDEQVPGVGRIDPGVGDPAGGHDRDPVEGDPFGHAR